MKITTSDLQIGSKGYAHTGPGSGARSAYPSISINTLQRILTHALPTVREDDILCLLESEREARRLR